MIISGNAIDKAVSDGQITIRPYDAAQLNPVSYNYRLGSHIIEVSGGREECSNHAHLMIPDDGYLLQPNRLYLASTFEEIGSSVFVPSLIGRSSVGRLGLFVQLAADLGNLGAVHRWTLELHCVQPIYVYAHMLLGQVSFWRPVGNKVLYSGLYSAHSNPTPNLRSKLET